MDVTAAIPSALVQPWTHLGHVGFDFPASDWAPKRVFGVKRVGTECQVFDMEMRGGQDLTNATLGSVDILQHR